MNKICPLFTKDISSPVTCLNGKCSFYNEETDNCSVNDLSVMFGRTVLMKTLPCFATVEDIEKYRKEIGRASCRERV